MTNRPTDTPRRGDAVPAPASPVTASRSRLVVPLVLAVLAIGAFAPGTWSDWGLYPALGVLPGVALAALLPLERGALARWALGIAISPLLVSVVALGLGRLGMPMALAARVVALAGTTLWVWTELRPRRAAPPAADARFAWRWALGAAALVAFVLFVNPYLRVRVDAWVHAGIVWEVVERGVPPQDPRFAGLMLNYVWIFNYFVGMVASLRDGDAFAIMAISNVGSMFVTMAMVWLIARQVWKSTRAAAGAALLMGLSYSGGVWILWPLRLLRAAVGPKHGPAEIARVLHDTHWNEALVVWDLCPSYGYMVNFLDKPLHGTAINIAYTFLLLYLWTMVRVLRGQGVAALAWATVATSGMYFFHGVVGLSAVPPAMAALGLAWLLAGRWRWLPPRRRVLAFMGATIAGSLLATPYTLAISNAWQSSKSGLHHQYIQIDLYQWVTLVTALAVPAWFARHSLARIVRERRGAAAALALFTLAMLGFSSIVTLPMLNHAKFVWEVFAGVAVLGGVAFHDEVAGWKRRFGTVGFAVLVAILFVGTPAITLRGYLLDRNGRTAPEFNSLPGEPALYAWMRARTSKSAVFVDRGYRSLIMVRARRQLLLGSPYGPEQAAFPMSEVLRRRAVMADLYGRADSLDRDVALIRELGRPSYVLLRAADADTGGSAAPRLDARPDLFARVYDRDGFIVYHVVPTDTVPSSRPAEILP